MIWSNQTTIKPLGAWLAVLLFFAAVPTHAEPATADTGTTNLVIRVLHATKQGHHIDPKIQPLVKDLGPLEFTSYRLQDEAVLELSTGSAGRMQMPNGEWMTIVLQAAAADGKARLVLESKKLKFKSTVSVDPGATIAVGGPPFNGGALIFAVTRPKTEP